MLIPAIAFAAGDGDGGGSDSFADKALFIKYLTAFGAGVFTSLTPCVYPMIPIVVGVFGARDESVTRRKAMLLGTSYVLGMCMLYATLGLTFALIGSKSGLGALLGNPWVVIPMVAFYVALAASMFGAFEMNLPMSWQNRLNRVGGKGYAGAFGMGLVGGLTAAPCTGPFLAAMLAWVTATASKGDMVAAGVTGFSILFVYALGIGVLFWLIAVFALSLPKSGGWMDYIKSIGGVALLAVGVFFLRPLIPAIEHMVERTPPYLIGSIAIAVVGLAIGAIHLSFHGSNTDRLRKASGVVLMVIGINGVANWVLTAERHLPWLTDEQAAFAQAKAENKGVMIDFAATWCTPCKELEITFSDQKVYDVLMKNYVHLKFDVTDDTDHDEAVKDKYKADTLPTVLFLDANGKELGRLRGKYMPPGEFMKKVLGPATGKLRDKTAQRASTSPPAGALAAE